MKTRAKTVGGGEHELSCMQCGKPIRVKFEAGDTPWEECCGFRYEWERDNIYLVVSKSNGMQVSPPDAGGGA